MNILSFSAFVGILLFTASCTSDPKSDEAKVSAAKSVKKVESSTGYDIVIDSSKVAWVGTKPTGRHDGFFPIAEGTLNVEDGKIVGGKIIIDVANLKVFDDDISPEDEQKLLRHLKSEDFFDVKQYPKAKFVITKVTPFKEDKKDRSQVPNTDSTTLEEEHEKSEFMLADPSHMVTGNLTLRSSTKSISVPAKVDIDNGRLTAKAKFNIDRTDWEISYGNEAKVVDKARDSFIYNKVNIGFDIVAVK